MLTYLVRLIYKHTYFLVFVLLIQTAAFASPPIIAEQAKTTRNQILNEAAKYLGVPYRYGGMSASGVDCSGLVGLVFQNALNISIPRTVEALYAWAEKIDTADLQAGDLVFFNTTGGISHVGIFIGNRKFINAASEGPHTGVIISSLDESYWARTYHGAGRAISQVSDEKVPAPALASAPTVDTAKPINTEISTEKENPVNPSKKNDSPFGFSLGGAVSWNNYIHETKVIRGAGFQLGLDYDLPIANAKLTLGLELRPEWDIQLGVFRLPITLSFGNDMFRAFAGPVLSVGNPMLSVPEGERYFDGGTSWLGEAGITFTPFLFNSISGGEFAFYAELAWQFYFPESGQIDNWMADLSAASRISTGFRYIFAN
jgi:probable lipoprotein NlpC